MPERLDLAVDLMTRFAERTGATSGGAGRRYLWTDAFAVCNFLGLAAATGDGRYAESALRLVERVHAVLGRHRGDDGRSGWLSGRSSLTPLCIAGQLHSSFAVFGDVPNK